MKLHLPSGLRSAIMACFAVVSACTITPSAAVLTGGVVAGFICLASPAMAATVQWDSNWALPDAPSSIPDANVLSAIPSNFTFLSEDGSPYLADGQTVVRLAGTAAGAADVIVIGGAGATSASTSESEGPLSADTWLDVTGGRYQVIAGGSYAQNYSGGEPASFTGDSHIQLSSSGSTAPTVDYIVGGNYMDAQSAPFTGDSYISIAGGTVNGSIVGGGTSAHLQTAVFKGNSNIWIYTPLAGSAANLFSLPGNLIVSGNAAVSNAAPKLSQVGDSRITIDFSSLPASASQGMEKVVIGDAFLLNDTSSSHSGTVSVSIHGRAADGGDVAFSQPVVAGSWFAGGGTASLSGETSLTLTGGSFSGVVVGGSYMAAGSGTATQTSGEIVIAVNGGTVSGTLYGGSYSLNEAAASSATHGSISISLAGGNILGNVYAGGGLGFVNGAAVSSVVKAASTQVEVSDAVILGAAGAPITISGGVQNANEASGVEGDRVLLLSGSNYANLDNVTFYDFNIVENASDATVRLQEVDAALTKRGAGNLTIVGVGSNLNPVAELTMEAGVLDTSSAWLTQGDRGLSSITVGQGASLKTAGLRLAEGAALSLNVEGASSALIAVDGDGGLAVSGQKTLALTLLGVNTLRAGSDISLISWNNSGDVLDLNAITWVNKGEDMAGYELALRGNALVLTHAEELVWDGAAEGTWEATGGNWEGQPSGASAGKAVSFGPTVGEASTVSISGNVTAQSITVDNAAGTTYTFQQVAGGSGSITGDTSLTKNDGGRLIMSLANTYTGGTTVNGGTLEAAVAGSPGVNAALGLGPVTLNENGTLLASAADAVAENALVFNGGILRYTADETRELGSAGVSHAAGVAPVVEVAGGSRVTWRYGDAAALQAAVGEGLSLGGGGSLSLESTSAAAEASLSGSISLKDAGTMLVMGSLGARQLGSEAAPMAISLEQGTSLRMEQPEAGSASAMHAALSGEGTLEFSNTNAAANSSVQLSGNNAGFAGSVNLGSEGEAPAASGTPAVLLDYSQGSPVGGTLNLYGLGFATALAGGSETVTPADVNVKRNTTQYAQTAGLNNIFTGGITADAATTWTLDSTAVEGGQMNTLAGELSGMSGTLEALGRDGSLARWQLGGENATAQADIAANFSASNAFNEFIMNYAAETTLSGTVSGQANLSQQGAGTLVLTGDNSSSGTLRIAAGSTVQLGRADDAGQWGDATNGSSLAGAGTLTLVNGTLNGTLTPEAGSSATVNVNVAAGQSVDLGRNAGSLITGGITLAEGATLTNVGSSILDQELNLTLGSANVGAGAAAAAMVEFSGTVTRALADRLGSESADISLDASASGVVELLRRHRVAGTESYLTLTNGQLVTAPDYSNVSFGDNMDILYELGLRIARVEGGSLVLSGAAQGVYVAGAGEDPTAATGYQSFGAWQAVAVMPGETLTLSLDGAPDAALDGDGATINNLLGAEDAALVVNNTDATGASGGAARVILNNSVQSIDPVPEGLSGDPRGADTTFGGSISQQGGDVEFVKAGAGTLRVGGAVTAHQLTLQEGALLLSAGGNALDVLALEGGEVQLNSGTTTAVRLEDSVRGGTISIAPGAVLSTTGSSLLEDALVTTATAAARAADSGTLQVVGELTLAEDARLDGVALDVAGGTLVLEETNAHRVTALHGSGTVRGSGMAETVGLSVTGTGGSFAGTLDGAGTLTLAEGSEQSFASSFTGSEDWNLENRGRMELDFAQPGGSNATLTLAAVNLAAGSTTDVRVNTDAPTRSLLQLDSLAMEQGARVNLYSASPLGNILRGGTSYIIGTTGGQAAGVIGNITLDTSSTVFMLLDAERSTLSVDENGNLVLSLVSNPRNTLASYAGNPNSSAGAALLWNAAYSGNTSTGTDIRRVLDALNSPAQAARAESVLAAVAGAGTAVLGSAFAADVERQLRALRNRSSMALGKPQAACEEQWADEPLFSAWINAEGDHRKMDADGLLPGYSLSSWGGTVGVDMSNSEFLTTGLALTAMYGDLDAHSADNASGDFDRYYLTAFARMTEQRWQHTFVGTVGRLDADLDRVVHYGTGSYRTHGDTKGWGWGLMYETGYSIPMNEEGSFILQPIANVSWRYVDIDGYTERGSDAGLRVGSQDYNVVTFGAGLRTQARLGEDGLLTRRALLEGRALVKVDAGDRSSEAAVALLGGGRGWGQVRSEKLGAVGVELGLGLTVPLEEDNGAFFIDGSAELRNEYSNLNGTVGYRLQF